MTTGANLRLIYYIFIYIDILLITLKCLQLYIPTHVLTILIINVRYAFYVA